MTSTDLQPLDREHRHRTVIIGSGFGGLFAAKRLSRAGTEVTLISKTNHHLFQPLLYQVATGILSEGEVAPTTRDILRKQRNVRVLLGDVTDIDLSRREVVSHAGGETTRTPYDSLIVAAGARTSYFGNDQFAAYAPGLKSIDNALDLRGRILSAFEFAEGASDDETRAQWQTFAVVGAGATGVEMAGQIAELAKRTLDRRFRETDPKSVRIVLIDAVDAVLGNFGVRLSEAATKHLQKLGIEVWLSEKVVDIDAVSITVEDTSGVRVAINARTIVWAAGVRASELTESLAKQSGADIDRSGRITVEADCTLPGHPEVFVVGDMMTLNNYPGVAQVAIQQGRYAADQIRRDLRGRARKPAFSYFDKGSMATVSRFNAVASVGPLRFGGIAAWMLWLVIHLVYLVGFKNRVTTVLHWAVSFVGRGRSELPLTARYLEPVNPVPAPPVPEPMRV